MEGRLAALRSEAGDRRARLEAEQANLGERKTLRARLQQRTQDAQQAVFDLRSQKEAAENAANLAQIRRTGLRDRLQSSRDNVGELEMQVRELAAQVDSGAQDKQQQLSLFGASDAVYPESQPRAGLRRGVGAASSASSSRRNSSCSNWRARSPGCGTDCTGHEIEQKTSARRHESLTADLTAAKDVHVAAAKAADELNARFVEATESRAALHSESIAAQQAIFDLTREFREAQRKIQELDRALAQRSARLKLLQQLREKFEGYGEGAKAILQGRLESAFAGTKPRAVTQGLEVKPAYGKAVDALLGAAVEAVAVADVATARRVLAQLESGQIGSAVLQVASSDSGIVAPPSLPPGLQPATAALVELDPAHPAAALLAACYVADDLGAFLDFLSANPAFGFSAVATARASSWTGAASSLAVT